jgi:hypothetical protein
MALPRAGLPPGPGFRRVALRVADFRRVALRRVVALAIAKSFLSVLKEK